MGIGETYNRTSKHIASDNTISSIAEVNKFIEWFKPEMFRGLKALDYK